MLKKNYDVIDVPFVWLADCYIVSGGINSSDVIITMLLHFLHFYFHFYFSCKMVHVYNVLVVTN